MTENESNKLSHTEDQIAGVLLRHLMGTTKKVIAAETGLSRTQINSILKHGEQWVPDIQRQIQRKLSGEMQRLGNKALTAFEEQIDNGSANAETLRKVLDSLGYMDSYQQTVLGQEVKKHVADSPPIVVTLNNFGMGPDQTFEIKDGTVQERAQLADDDEDNDSACVTA